MEHGSTSMSTSDYSNGYRNYGSEPKHKVFLSHSGAQKGFVEQLCVDLERCDRHAFLDKRRDSLPIGKDFPKLIFEAIELCEVGVLVLSEEFFTSKWPMLELVAMTKVKMRDPSFTIMPILLGITLSQCRDIDNHKRWSSIWQTWAKSDSRIEVKDWENALQLFGPTNALKYNAELGEVKFREEIVEAICSLVPPETRFEDSHIQGRPRLCKVIHENIKQPRMSSLYGVRVIGLYGVGGIGKTTICKALCNDLSKEYRGKVAHVELGSHSEVELFKEVLGRLSDKRLELLGAMNVDEYRYHLMRDMMNVGVFLAIDNVSSATTKQALTFLRANYGPRSVLLVTARSLNELMSLKLNASECMEMPELEIEEAKSLFLHHAACVPSTYLDVKADYELISSCIQRCYFKKGNGSSSHYHPLALQTLGEQLGCIGYVRERWWALLNEIDFLNPFREPQHPVFSILRRSFDTLDAQDQLLFMDVALFVPSISSLSDSGYMWNNFEWCSMVHGIPVSSVIERLENLKRKSLLENLGNGFSKVGMHDLWHEFARLETKVGEFEKRRWIFEWDEYNAFEEGSVTRGGLWVNVKRMFFLDRGFIKLEEVNFSSFSNLMVLKLNNWTNASRQELDLSGLKHLRSLELDGWMVLRTNSPGSLSKLCYLRWDEIPLDSPCSDEVRCLTSLQVLDLCGCGRLPNLSNLILLRVAYFRYNDIVESITGLSPKHTNLRYLELSRCKELQSCPGVGELVALEELSLWGCSKLKEVPNLQKLKQLRKLDVGECLSIIALPGLDDLVGLRELNACSCLSLAELPDICNLRNLQILDLQFCVLIESLPGLDELTCLQSLKTRGCRNLTQLPDMHKLTNLCTLESNRVQSAVGLSDLISLRNLVISFDELQDGPDICKLTKLEALHIGGWRGEGFSSLANLVLLESVSINDCKGVCALPNLQRLTRLHDLEFGRCEFEDMSSLSNLTSLQELRIWGCDKLEVFPDLCKLARLKELRVVDCARLRDLRGILALRGLETLEASGYPWLHENLGSDLDFQRMTSLRFLDVSGSGFADL